MDWCWRYTVPQGSGDDLPGKLAAATGRAEAAEQALSALQRERDELRAAINPKAASHWSHLMFVRLAEAHQQDSDMCDELQDEYGSIREGWRTKAKLLSSDASEHKE